MGVPARWGMQAHVVDEPDGGALDAALDWLRARRADFVLRTPHRWAGSAAFSLRGLHPVDALPALALVLDPWSAPPPPAGLEISAPRSRAEFVEAYAGSFAMPVELAEALVAPADLDSPSSAHLVGRVDGVTVGTAMLRVANGCGCVSGVGVLPAYRGRGVGSALTAAATTAARERGCDVAFLHATDVGRGLYERLGYAQIDVHVDLAPSAETEAT